MLEWQHLMLPVQILRGCQGKFGILFFFFFCSTIFSCLFFPNKINVTEIKAHCVGVAGGQLQAWLRMLIHHTADKLLPQ